LFEPDPLFLDEVIVQEYPGNYNISCFGSYDGAVLLNGISGGHEGRGYTFDWMTISGGSIPDTSLRNQTGLGAGRYSVIVSDTFNCMTSDTFDLIQPGELQMQAELSESSTGIYNLKCFGDNSGYIILHPEGGDTTDGPYEFNWQQGSTAGELHDLKAGDYVVTVRDGIQCAITDTITLTEPEAMQIDSAILSDYHGFEVSCSGNNDGIIRIAGRGGEGPYTYNWKLDGVTLVQDSSYIDGLSEGTYILTLTDVNKCGITWEETLESPEPLVSLIESTNLNCTGTVLGTARVLVMGGMPDYSYSWDSGETTREISGLDSGLHIVTITDSNLCQLTDTAMIMQNSTVQIEIQVVDSISCYLGSDGILRAEVRDGIAPYNYLWNNGIRTETLSGVQEGSYNVTVTDMDGCTNNLSILITDPMPIVPRLEISDASCFRFSDGSVELDASGGRGGYTYYWNGIQLNGTTVDQLKAESYTLRIIDAENCRVDTMVTIREPGNLHMDLNELHTIYPFCPDWENGAVAITVTGGTPQYNFHWTDYPDEADSILNDVKENIYAVQVVDAMGCRADSVFRLIALNNTCLGIPTAFTPNYDNANDTWDISYITENGGESTFHEIYPNGIIQVYDRLGNIVYRCTGGCPEAWNGEDLKGRRLPADSYYFIIELNNGENMTPIKGVVTIIR